MTQSAARAAIDRFIEEMGLLAQSNGDPRIAGRIAGLMFVEAREMSLHEISERLGVSRASVSTNARLMARRGILRLTAHPGDRQDYYALAADPHFHFLDEIAHRLAQSAQTIGACADEIGRHAPPVAQRIRSLGEFHRFMADRLGEWAERKQAERDRAPTDATDR